MSQKKNFFTFKIGGEAGFGIVSSSLMFSRLAVDLGYHVFDWMEYPSLVRGGHNIAGVILSSEVVRSPRLKTNCLVALDQKTINLHHQELKKGSFLIFDSEQSMKVDQINLTQGVVLIDIPFYRLAKDIGGTILMRNTAVMGALTAILGWEIELLKNQIAKNFSNKEFLVTQLNDQVAQAGYDFVMENFSKKIINWLPRIENKKERMLINANQSVGMGAVNAGLGFASIYPMTPTSGILDYLVNIATKEGFICVQPEDEISSINMAIGASFAGARSMVATSGGGFCLMSEGYGLAGLTETPLVIIEGQRGGPATGLPTWTEQGDLRFVLHAHQSDFPRIVLAPGDAQEAFELTRKAFDLADRYQTTVVILLDKDLCESHRDFEFFNYETRLDRGKLILEKKDNYQRYQLSRNGISARSIPGLGHRVFANSDEHNQAGLSEESSQNRVHQMTKRMQKIKSCADKDLPKPSFYGDEKNDLLIVAWGSTKGAVLDALKELTGVSFLHLNWVSPFPASAVKKHLDRYSKIICIEGNYSGQLAGLIKEQTGVEIVERFCKFDGRSIYPEEIINVVRKLKTKKIIKRKINAKNSN